MKEITKDLAKVVLAIGMVVISACAAQRTARLCKGVATECYGDK